MIVDRKTFVAEQINVLIQCKTLIKYKDFGCPTIMTSGGQVLLPCWFYNVRHQTTKEECKSSSNHPRQTIFSNC